MTKKNNLVRVANRLLVPAIAIVCSYSATAQTKDGGLSTEMLQQIVNNQRNSSSDKALFNAMAGNSIDNLAKSYMSNSDNDTHFSVETMAQNIHDQKSSGRCWMFSGFNVLRSNFAKKTDSLRVEFSHAYLFFYDQLEKSNLFLQGVIDTGKLPIDDPKVQFFFKNPVADGGTFCGVADLTEKYGLVPNTVMPETYNAENTSKMRSLLMSKLREQGLRLRDMVAQGKSKKQIKEEKAKMLGVVYRILTLTLGNPTQQFSYAFKNKDGKTVGTPRNYTPQEFYREVAGTPLNGTFIMVMNDPRHEYHKTYEVEYDRHTYDGHNWVYLNLPMEEIAELAIASLKDGRKMYSSYDVGKQLDRKKGLLTLDNFDYESLLGTTFPMNKAQRISTFDSGSTHAMTLSAVDLDANGKPLKWKVENSWGPEYGHKGCLIMTNEWFNEYMFRLVVDKKYVSEKLLKEAQQKPIMLTPDDPLFAEDN
ncbi:aminopeptidase C [Prevotella sp. OH937_COT-195]|uniref:aminopeptidase C n=1 Tax=Prevotella sp. OH937_COT-195 TaxID=2491051 RepID=UPI000F648F18|nr:C1 family peptidase [Prevotella sp. OH937_COT-195]RRD02364.1 aminopeptidase [Prevotella sp. OH937_COT-195]